MQINFPDPFPILETKRLTLSPVLRSDNETLLEIYSMIEVMIHRGVDCYSSLEESNQLIESFLLSFNEKKGIRWALRFKGQDQLIGTCGFKYIHYDHFRSEIGYELHPWYWNRGLMTEALESVLEVGFAMGLHSVEANIAPDNYASAKVLHKAGFEKEAHFRENYYYNGGFMDSVIYSKLNPLQI